MDHYTKVLEDFAQSISPESDSYEKDLIKVASSFRTFAVAFDDFLSEQGYGGDLGDVQQKTEYLKDKFKTAIIPVPRGIKEWFISPKKIERKTAFQICFAFELDLEGTDDFFRRVYFERSFDCHCVEEAIYYFCIKNGFSYREAETMLKEVPGVKQDKIPSGTEVLYTGTIIESIKHLVDPKEMVAYLTEHITQFGYNNATATGFIQSLWNQITKSEGLAYKEGLVIGRYDTTDTFITARPNDSQWNVLSQIFGLDTYWHDRFSSTRSIKPILLKNSLIPPLAEASFPDRDAINKALNNAHLSHERVRKLLILLVFYSYWAKLVVEKQDIQFIATDIQAEKCIFTINKYLLDAGYPELYMGNPYDWVFLWATNDDFPLMTFRDYMKEIFAVKSEM